MEMTTVKSIFRNKGTYIDKEVKLGAWFEKFVLKRILVS